MKRSISGTTTLTVVVTFLLLFGMAARTPLDTDLFWHLRAGEETLRSGQPLMVDLFSHTRYAEAWINHSWLSQVGMALLFQAGGYQALGAVMALLATLSMVFVFLQCRGPLALSMLVLILSGVVASVVWVARPQLVSMVLIALVSYILYLYKWRQIDRLWLLPLVFILWSNLHGGYVLGFLLLLATLAGEALNHLLARQATEVIAWRRLRRLLAWTLVVVFAVLVNPNGFDTWLIPFQTVNVGVLQQLISEWASPDFHALLQQSFLWLLFLTFAAVSLSGREIDGTDLLTLIGFAYLALVARRNFGPFALVAAPILVRHATGALCNWEARMQTSSSPLLRYLPALSAAVRETDIDLKGADRPPIARIPGWQRVLNLAIAALIALIVILKLFVVTHPVLVGSYMEQQYPVRAVDWLAANGQNGRLLNEYNWGGYIQWVLRDTPVFVDGRTDLFGDQVIGDWMALVSAGENWQDLLVKYQIDLMLVEAGRPLVEKLDEAGWQLLYMDEQAVIYARNGR